MNILMVGIILILSKTCDCLCPDTCIECTSPSECSACSPGYYGQSCQSECSTGCKTPDCAWHYGQCDCREGFTALNCRYCVDGKHGEHCDINCPDTCVACVSDASCNSCKTGWYGDTCESPCSANCNGSCYKETGACSTCIDGYSGDKCCVQHNNCYHCSSDTICGQCDDGYFGDQCQIPCPGSCVGLCQKDSGYCNTCKHGSFGSNCQSSCSENCVGPCGRKTGICYVCKDRFFGSKCEFECSQNCDRCDFTGTCVLCKDGFYGPECSKHCPINCIKCTNDMICIACNDGFYGITCEHQCPEMCISCYSKSYCTTCMDGYTGRTCSAQCDSTCNTCLIDSNNRCTSCARGRYALASNISVDILEGSEYMFCTNNCSKYCLHGFCESSTGSCLGGCVQGYTADRCTCPENCRNDSCLDSGRCDSSNCDGIFSGSSCACINGTCSDFPCDKCESNMLYVSGDMCCKCPSTCRDSTCSDENTCLQGCMDGFYGKGCRSRCHNFDIWCLSCTENNCSKCLPGYFPSNGRCKACSSSCVNETCSSADGACLEACQNGLLGAHCTEQCGQNCSKCDRYNGSCSVCETGKYGRDCARNCSDQCKSFGESAMCDIDDGSCSLGCASNNTHGTMCHLDCNTTCSGQTCHWETGKCTTGCILGYHGEWCENQCSEHCEDRFSCNNTDGMCHHGCNNGFYKHDCRARCAATCINETCERDTGYCSHGCIEGFTGVACVEDAEQSVPDTTGVMDSVVPGSMGVTVAMVAGMVLVGASVFILLTSAVVAIVCLIRRRKRHRSNPTNNQNVPMIGSDEAHTQYLDYFGISTCAQYSISRPSGDVHAVDTAVSDTNRASDDDVIYEYIAEEITDGPVDARYMNTHVQPVKNTVEQRTNMYEQPDRYINTHVQPVKNTVEQRTNMYEHPDRYINTHVHSVQNTVEQRTNMYEHPDRYINTHVQPVKNTVEQRTNMYEQPDRYINTHVHSVQNTVEQRTNMYEHPARYINTHVQSVQNTIEQRTNMYEQPDTYIAMHDRITYEASTQTIHVVMPGSTDHEHNDVASLSPADGSAYIEPDQRPLSATYECLDHDEASSEYTYITATY